jgi:hypothetical protein
MVAALAALGAAPGGGVREPFFPKGAPPLPSQIVFGGE